MLRLYQISWQGFNKVLGCVKPPDRTSTCCQRLSDILTQTDILFPTTKHVCALLKLCQASSQSFNTVPTWVRLSGISQHRVEFVSGRFTELQHDVDMSQAIWNMSTSCWICVRPFDSASTQCQGVSDTLTQTNMPFSITKTRRYREDVPGPLTQVWTSC